MPHIVVGTLSKALHTCQELILGHERVQAHRSGVIVRGIDPGVIIGINIVDLPLGPVEVMWDRIQVVKLLGYDRPGWVSEQRFGKRCHLLTDHGFWTSDDQVLQRDDLALWGQHVRFTFAKGRLVGARVYHPGHNGNSAAHPELIESGPIHVIRIIRLSIQTKSLARCAEGPAGVTVQQLQNAVVLVEAILEHGIGSRAGSIDHILLRVFVKFIRENGS